MGDIRVINRRTMKSLDLSNTQTIYIGRPHILGNPYSHLPSEIARYKVDNREDAVAMYELWLIAQIRNRNMAIIKELDRIANLVMDSKNTIALVCWCSPAPCHGDVLKRFIENAIATKKAQCSNLTVLQKPALSV